MLRESIREDTDSISRISANTDVHEVSPDTSPHLFGTDAMSRRERADPRHQA
jgi:hypothetical protein